MRITTEASASDPGVRPQNEDGLLRLPTLPLFAVADGMGGAGVGDVAARLALDEVIRGATELQRQIEKVAVARTAAHRLELGQLLHRLFNGAGKEIRAEARHRRVVGMASTLLVATVVGSALFIAHVGNSRAYLLRQGRLIRLTEDHSVAEFRYRRGRMDYEEYLVSDKRLVLYQALGSGTEVDVDLYEVRLAAADILLLCTDGLDRALSEDRIVELIAPDNLRASVDRLVSAAKEAAAPDNLTLLLLGLTPEPGDEPIEELTGVMENVFLFEGLSHRERLVLAPYLEEVRFERGEVVAQEGELAEQFGLVLSGRLRGNIGPTLLSDLTAGAHFGELALTRHGRHIASWSAAEPTTLLFLSRDRFHQLLLHKPELGGRLAMRLADQLGGRVRTLGGRLRKVRKVLDA